MPITLNLWSWRPVRRAFIYLLFPIIAITAILSCFFPAILLEFLGLSLMQSAVFMLVGLAMALFLQMHGLVVEYSGRKLKYSHVLFQILTMTPFLFVMFICSLYIMYG